MTEPFTHHILAGTSADAGKVFVTIKWDGKRLSLTGVVGPKPSGDARGGCGQIDVAAEVTKPAKGIDVARLADLWKRWHLNDMNAGCEHQRATLDLSKTVEIVTYQLTSEALSESGAVMTRAKKLLRDGETVQLSAEDRALAALPFQMTTAPDADSIGSGRYKVVKRETKSVGWVNVNEHPDGLLSKPCPECGYKYGTAWLREEVPADVIAELHALPTSDALPTRWH
ncbi:MAG: hypothetical protein GY769_20190 [bacterium]|nr:hypothetical protein [bacterium]